MAQEVKLINFKLTDVLHIYCQTNNKGNALILNPLIRICVSRKFSDLCCVNRGFLLKLSHPLKQSKLVMPAANVAIHFKLVTVTVVKRYEKKKTACSNSQSDCRKS